MGEISASLSNSELTRLFFAIVLLLSSAHFFGYIFYRAKLPRVIGEISGGFLLGPTVLGNLSPNAYNWLFYAFKEESKLISIFYWLGLIFLMFISGFEVQKSFDYEDKKITFAIFLGSTILPFIAGFIFPLFFGVSLFIGEKGNVLALQLITGISVAITAIPVISKIFIDLNIIRTRFAKIVIATATLHDILLWCVLAVASGLVSSKVKSLFGIVTTVLITLSFFALSLFAMPKIVKFVNSLKYNFLIKSSVSGYSLVICFIFVAIASILNINIVFGAFLAGIIIGLMDDEKFAKERMHIKEIALSFFIPLYLAIVGLKLDLVHYFDLKLFLGFLVFATIFSAAGTLIAARIAVKDWLSSFNLAIAMNSRGAVGVVLATVALELGIINETFFGVLVLAAIATTLFAGYWFRYILSSGWELFKSA